MAVDLAIIADIARQITNFKIEKVNERDMQALWARVAGIGTGFPEIVVEPFVQLEVSLGGAEYRAQHRYIGFREICRYSHYLQSSGQE